MTQISKKEHEQFLEDCKNMTIYLKYLHHQFKTAESYNYDILKKYHSAYVQMVSTYKDFSGSGLRITIKGIVDSTRSAEEKYKEYIRCLNENIEQYNKAYAVRLNKQIRV